MESRKIQVSAGGSFFIVLPKDWSKDIGLKKGGRVNVILEEDGSIKLLPSDRLRDLVRKATLQVEEFSAPKPLDFQIKAYYMSGCNIIDIVSKKRIDPELKKAIKTSAGELIGVETAEETSDRLSLRAIVDPAGFPLENLHRRLCTLSLSMYSDTMKAFREKDLDLVDDVIERGQEAMKLYRLMIRQLMLAHANRNVAKSLGIEHSSQCITMGIFARDVSRFIYHISSTAVHTREILKTQTTYQDSITKATMKLFESIFEMVKNAFKAFMERDIPLANKVIKHMGEVRKLDEIAEREIFQNLKEVQTAIRLAAIIRELRRTAGYAVAMADDTIFHNTIS